MTYTEHYSVLKEECIDFLTETIEQHCKETSYFADLTFGSGGHSLALLERNDHFNLLSLDQDPEAISNGNITIEKLNLQTRIQLIHDNFINFTNLVKEKHHHILEKPGGFQGIILDLGVSSHHFDSGARGFSFRTESQLDMRMDISKKDSLKAVDIVNNYSIEELLSVFQKYGEERFSNRIAEKIISERVKKRIESTKDLENIIFHCYPRKLRYGRTNPSTKVFQALRIEVNDELNILSDTIPRLISLLKTQGRLAIISFHSLEDRIVKNRFKETKMGSKNYKIITKKPIIPKENEIKKNSRSRSAKLRVIERLY